jgi:hypothetical protein
MHGHMNVKLLRKPFHLNVWTPKCLINEQNTCDYISLYELRPSAETRIIVNRLCDKSAY